MPIKRLRERSATRPVVPDPKNGSRTMSPFALPARMHGFMSSSGNTAKCASLYGLVVTVHTDRLFLISPPTAFIFPLLLFGTRFDPFWFFSDGWDNRFSVDSVDRSLIASWS